MQVSAYDKAVYLLSIREHSRKELSDKLEKKGFGKEDISLALDRLENEGYLSERRFGEVFIRSRLKKNPEGRQILLCRLMEKGCDREVAVSALEDAWDDKLWLEPLKTELNRIEKKKGIEYARAKMRQKGFTIGEIREAEEYNE